MKADPDLKDCAGAWGGAVWVIVLDSPASWAHPWLLWFRRSLLLTDRPAVLFDPLARLAISRSYH